MPSFQSLPENQDKSVLSPEHHHHRPLLAAGLRLVAIFATMIMFAGIKYASQRGVNLVELAFYRQFFALPIVMTAVILGPGLASLKTQRIGAHINRTVVGQTSMLCAIIGITHLPLAMSTSVGFTTPIFATLFSALVLREATGWHRWAAVLTGFGGVLIIANPTAHGSSPALWVTASLMGALLGAVVAILLRQMSRSEPTMSVVFWFTVLGIPPLGLAMIFYAQPHDMNTWALLLGMGTVGGLAQYLLTAALRYGSVSLVLPMDYSSLLWAAVFGWLFWNHWPDFRTWVGAAFIVGSGLYIVWREHVHHVEITTKIVTD